MIDKALSDRLHHIREHPEQHQHDFKSLHACCTINGAVNLLLMDAHATYASPGTNGGTRCDVTSGPCACGAWH